MTRLTISLCAASCAAIALIAAAYAYQVMNDPGPIALLRTSAFLIFVLVAMVLAHKFKVWHRQMKS